MRGGRALGGPPVAGGTGRRRVRVPLVLGGVLIVLIGAVAGARVASRVDDRVSVLAMARAVKAGQVIADADLVSAQVNVDAAVTTMPAADKAQVLGRTAAMPLAKGTLLGASQVGAPAWPAAGEALAAVAVKAGRAPAGLSAGMRVTVFIVASAQPGTAGTQPDATVQADATVESVQQATDSSGGLLVTVLTQTQAAQRIAAAPGDAALVQHGAER